MEEPPKKFYRLAPGREVRLRYAYFITCTNVVKDEGGEVIELRCTYDPETKGGDAPDGRKVKATLHWVSAQHAVGVEVRVFERLFTVEDPLGLDAMAKEKGVTVVPDCGVAPGLSNILVGYAASRLDTVKTAHFMVGGIPEKPVPPLGYTITWSADGLVDEYVRDVSINCSFGGL